jgi:hypothetical protein
MLSSLRLVQLGDLELTLPAAAAMSASLLASNARRMALWWILLFLAGIGLVGATKIAYLGWGIGWHAVGFKAISGHATGVSAVFPMLFFLLLLGYGRQAQLFGIGAGLALGALIAVLLVVLRHHTTAEVLAGWLVGATVSLGAIRLADGLPPPRPVAGTLWFALTFGIGVWLMKSAHVGYWMIQAARLLSDNTTLFRLGYD